MKKYLKTSDIARAAGVHPNTVRLYEEWGFLPPVPRNDKGYRLYTAEHLDQMQLARTAFKCDFVAANIRSSAASVAKLAASRALTEALEAAREHLRHIQAEQVKAEEALHLLRHWVRENSPPSSNETYTTREVLQLLDLKMDTLRNWERNNLIGIPRNPLNGYRMFRLQEINRLKIIRTLRCANYSLMSILRLMVYIDSGKKEQLEMVITTPGPDEDIVYATDRWLLALKDAETFAVEMIEHLVSMIKKNSNPPL